MIFIVTLPLWLAGASAVGLGLLAGLSILDGSYKPTDPVAARVIAPSLLLIGWVILILSAWICGL